MQASENMPAAFTTASTKGGIQDLKTLRAIRTVLEDVDDVGGEWRQD